MDKIALLSHTIQSEEYRILFYNVSDNIIAAIKEHFTQPSFKTYGKLVGLLGHGTSA